MADMTLDIARITYELEEEPVRVLPLETKTDIKLDGIQIQLIKDQEINVALWMAEILEKEGLVAIQSDEIVSPSSLNLIVRKEGDARSITQVSSLLFRRVRIEIDRLRKENNTNALRRLASIEGSFNTIVRLRNKKILTMAFGGQLDSRTKNQLTTEELWLFQHLEGLFEVYAKSVGSSSDQLGDE